MDAFSSISRIFASEKRTRKKRKRLIRVQGWEVTVLLLQAVLFVMAIFIATAR
jgi:hypothetical protein